MERVDFPAIRKVFTDAGFTEQEILEALGLSDFSSLRSGDSDMLMAKTALPTPLNTLVRLFCMEAVCPIDDVGKAVSPMGMEEWAEAGLITREGPMARACLKILPYHNLLIGFDPAWTLNTPQAGGYVMGIGSSTLTLANLTIRKQCHSTLDLGTGCGFHAFMAASHSEEVHGVDINPRAVTIASLNRLLNGLTQVSFHEGDLFGPVSGMRFDLVIANPPFVISPEKTYIYRDSGLDADAITKKIVQTVPEYLNPGGFCQILCNWAEMKGTDYRERLASWFRGTGCDAWVIRTETADPASYAATWIRHTERGQESMFAEKHARWTAYYEEQGIEGLSAGLITLRRSARPKPWFRADQGPDRMLGPAGDALLQGFLLKDFLEDRKSDDDLLQARCRVDPDLSLDRTSVPTEDGWVDTALTIRLNRGLSYAGNIDYFVMDLLMGCDGSATLAELLDRMARTMKKDRSAIAQAFCPVVRGLIEKGFLLPV